MVIQKPAKETEAIEKITKIMTNWRGRSLISASLPKVQDEDFESIEKDFKKKRNAEWQKVISGNCRSQNDLEKIAKKFEDFIKNLKSLKTNQ